MPRYNAVCRTGKCSFLKQITASDLWSARQIAHLDHQVASPACVILEDVSLEEEHDQEADVTD